MVTTSARAADHATREDRLTAVHEMLVDAVERLTGSEAWRQMLTVAARFPTYSASNVLLIAAQRPGATKVAGIRTWNALGRRVTKGEHGSAILAPCLYTKADEEPAGSQPSTASAPATTEAGRSEASNAVARRELRDFTVVHVFDVAQTAGDPLPDLAPRLLTGPAPEALYDHLVHQVWAAGYTLEHDDCGDAYGWTDPARKAPRIRPDLDRFHALKTLAHELGHIRADHPARFPDYAKDRSRRGQAEIEAESIAHLVLSIAGVDTGAHSVPYLAGWAGGDAGRVREAAAIVVTTARALAPVLGASAAFGPDAGSSAGSLPTVVPRPDKAIPMGHSRAAAPFR